MNQYNLSAKKTSLVCVLVLVLTNTFFFLEPVQAQQSQNESSLFETIKKLFFGSRPGRIPKQRRKGGSVRGVCRNLSENVNQKVLALVPSEQGTFFVEQTISERPIFWVYVPSFPMDKVNKAEFVLLDNQDKEVYSTIIPLQNSSMMMGMQLPKTVNPLQLGHKYHWGFSVICNPDDRTKDAIVDGWIERIPVDNALKNHLKIASNRERLTLYINARLWSETLTSLTELQRSKLQNQEIKSDWVKVLKLMDLPENSTPTWTIYPLPPQVESGR